MVMRARDLVYHLNCFTCTTCNKMLTTGDHFGMKDSLVYCRLHFESLIQGDFPTHFNHTDVAPNKGLGSTGPLGLSYYNGVNTVQKGRPRKRKSPGPGADLAAYNAGETIIGVLLLLVNCSSFILCILFLSFGTKCKQISYLKLHNFFFRSALLCNVSLLVHCDFDEFPGLQNFLGCTT